MIRIFFVLFLLSSHSLARDIGQTEITTEEGIEVFQKEKYYLLKKNVNIVSDNFELSANLVKAFFEKDLYDITKIESEGRVKLSSNKGIVASGEKINFSTKNEDIHIFGNGNQIMDMIYVKDLVTVLVKALILDHQNWDKIIEAGSGEKTTVNHICSEVLKITNSNSNVIHDKMRGGEPDNAVVLGNTETLKCVGIDVNNFTSLYDGINKTVKYYKNSIG